MKWNKLLPVLLLLFTLAACGGEGETQDKVEKRCEEIVGLYQDIYVAAQKEVPETRWDTPRVSQTDLDAMEDRLRAAGLDVLDFQGVEYLPTGDNFRGFLQRLSRGETARQEVLSLRPSGALGYRLFTCQDGELFVHSMVAPLDTGEDPNYELHQVLDWELTDRGNFYYRIRPMGDGHYADYALIRLEKPDPALWEQTRKYIWAGGYVGSNLFLTDWTEEDFSGLCFNDLWEYLYRDAYGTQFSPEGYDYRADDHCFEIPAREFETVILSYFDIDRQTLRTLAEYDPEADAYPWRQIQSNELVSILHYYTMEPEVIASRLEDDGTLILTVQVLSTDLRTDCLFSHEVTVRPREDGGFQFVANRMLSQTEYGLPYCRSRLSWPVSG